MFSILLGCGCKSRDQGVNFSCCGTGAALLDTPIGIALAVFAILGFDGVLPIPKAACIAMTVPAAIELIPLAISCCCFHIAAKSKK